MKNQWFGDIHDFRKYGLLCYLAKYYDEILVDWMLTGDIKKTNDGKKIKFANRKYYWAPAKSGEIQKEIWNFFNKFHHSEPRQKREVSRAVDIFALDIFSQSHRKCNFITSSDENWELKKTDPLDKNSLMFFDADNGIADDINRKTIAGNNNPYIYSDEIKSAFSEGHDILVYQHIPRMTLDKLIDEKRSILKKTTSNSTLIFKAGGVVYFLLLHDNGVAANIRRGFRDARFTNAYLSIVDEYSR